MGRSVWTQCAIPHLDTWELCVLNAAKAWKRRIDKEMREDGVKPADRKKWFKKYNYSTADNRLYLMTAHLQEQQRREGIAERTGTPLHQIPIRKLP